MNQSREQQVGALQQKYEGLQRLLERAKRAEILVTTEAWTLDIEPMLLKHIKDFQEKTVWSVQDGEFPLARARTSRSKKILDKVIEDSTRREKIEEEMEAVATKIETERKRNQGRI
ncbi:MAG: hypothetical protein GY725_05945 [bacterium]|nr:hypothetical protein [bacterium]